MSKEHIKVMKHLGLLRLLIITVAIFWGVTEGIGQIPTSQAKTTPKTPAASPASQVASTPAQDKVWVKDPNSVMPTRRMTLAERRAAAQRNHDRKAKAEGQRKQTTRASQGVR